MAAASIDVFPIVFPRPTYVSAQISYQTLPLNQSYSQSDNSDIVTLSGNGASAGDIISGLFYVPDIDETSSCYNDSALYVPVNVTRQRDLPDGDYQLVAIAPWLKPKCVDLYLAAAATYQTKVFLTFLPGEGSATPPNATNSIWNFGALQQWNSGNSFPTYALPSSKGLRLLQYSAFYSGSLTSAPFGPQLAKLYDPEDYLRLLATINISGSSLPSLWVFLLAVLGILLIVIGVTSLSMHLVQRRRREQLRRRVANGEVDLEALGIKRLTVPQHLLDEMPLYTYGTESRSVAATASAEQYRPSALQQPTCAICLDDFVPASDGSEGTIVRELPCRHIFHPECVDTFLRESSSLCPMCKKTSLPPGYCPQVVTNAMVRRERAVRQLRSSASTVDGQNGNTPLSLSAAMRRRTVSNLARWRTRPSQPPGASIRSSDQPMVPLEALGSAAPAESQSATGIPISLRNTTAVQASDTATPTVQPSSNLNRREWARQRALAMLGPRHDGTLIDPDAEEAARTPRWRKAVQGIFPGLGIRG